MLFSCYIIQPNYQFCGNVLHILVIGFWLHLDCKLCLSWPDKPARGALGKNEQLGPN